MKVLVTGGAGFIGSHVVDLLINRGHDVSIVDNLSTGKKRNVNKNAAFHKTDIRNFNALEKIFKKEGFEAVVHLAAQPNVRRSIEDPVFDAENNIIGSLNIIKLSEKYKVGKMVYSSSGGACYGEPSYLPCDEKHPVSPLSPYGVSKYTVENYLNQSALQKCILRFANVYGPRQDPKGEAGVVAIFAEQMLKNKPPKIFGDGRQTRDFVYVLDVAHAIPPALEKNGTFNIGTGKQISVNDVYGAIKKAVSYQGRKIHDQPIKGEIKDICLDASKAAKELHWKPTVKFEEGIKKTVQWHKECFQ